jgi:chlorite dismutase
MGQPVLLLFMSRMKDSWYELSEEERDALMDKYQQADDEIGVKHLADGSCEWSTPEYHFIGAREYPSIKAIQKHFDVLREIGFADHVEKNTYVVGTSWESQGDGE